MKLDTPAARGQRSVSAVVAFLAMGLAIASGACEPGDRAPARSPKPRPPPPEPTFQASVAWMQNLVASAVTRDGRPKRVLAFVDVLDRPAVDLSLHGVGYTTREPVELVSKAKDEMIADIPADVISSWRAQLERSRAKAEGAKAGPEKTFWTARQKALAVVVVVDKRGACCVMQSALAAP